MVKNQNAVTTFAFVNLTDPRLLPKLLTVSFIGLYKKVYFQRGHIVLEQMTSSLALTLLICTCPMGHHSSLKVCIL